MEGAAALQPLTLWNFGMSKQSMEARILSAIEHIDARLEKTIGIFLNY